MTHFSWLDPDWARARVAAQLDHERPLFRPWRTPAQVDARDAHVTLARLDARTPKRPLTQADLLTIGSYRAFLRKIGTSDDPAVRQFAYDEAIWLERYPRAMAMHIRGTWALAASQVQANRRCETAVALLQRLSDMYDDPGMVQKPEHPAREIARAIWHDWAASHAVRP